MSSVDLPIGATNGNASISKLTIILNENHTCRIYGACKTRLRLPGMTTDKGSQMRLSRKGSVSPSAKANRLCEIETCKTSHSRSIANCMNMTPATSSGGEKTDHSLYVWLAFRTHPLPLDCSSGKVVCIVPSLSRIAIPSVASLPSFPLIFVSNLKNSLIHAHVH